MRMQTTRERYIRTDREEWTPERLRRRISENERLLAKIDRMSPPDPRLEPIRALLAHDLRRERPLLAALASGGGGDG